MAAESFCNFVEKPIESSVMTEPAWPLFQAWNMTAGHQRIQQPLPCFKVFKGAWIAPPGPLIWRKNLPAALTVN
jgi:hypothetical protein